MDLINLADYEAAARAKTDPMHFGYYASSAGRLSDLTPDLVPGSSPMSDGGG